MLASQWVWQLTKSVSIPAEEQNAGRVVDYFYRMEFHITPRFFSDSNCLFFFFFLIIYLKRRVCFGPVCECGLNWSRGAQVGEKRERGNKYTRIHPSIPKRSDPYSLYYFLTTTPLHCVVVCKNNKTSSKLFYTNDFIERILQDPKDPEGRCANKTYPPPDRRPKRQVHKQKRNTEQKRNPEPCNDRQRPNTASVNLYKDLRNYGLLSSHLGRSPPF